MKKEQYDELLKLGKVTEQEINISEEEKLDEKGAVKKILEFIVLIFSVKKEENSYKDIKQRYSVNNIRVWVFTLLGYGILFLLILMMLSKLVFQEEIKQNVLIASLIMLFHFIVSWFNIVGKKQRGAVYFFEKPLYNAGRGIHFIPWLICELDANSRTYFEDELPANPEKIHRVKRGEPDSVPVELLEKGYKPPLRITFTGLTKKEIKARKKSREEGIDVDDPLEERITVEVPGIVIWRIVDLIVFTQTIGDEAEAQKQMGDVFISMMTTELSKVTLKKFLETKESYDGRLEYSLKELTKSWGIEIITARTKEYRGSRELNILIQGIAEAKAKKRSDALEGKGLGDREEAILRGRTEGFKYMKDKLGVTSESILSIETARKIAEEVDTLVAVGGESAFTDLMKIAVTTTGILNSKDKVPAEIETKEVDHE